MFFSLFLDTVLEKYKCLYKVIIHHGYGCGGGGEHCTPTSILVLVTLVGIGCAISIPPAVLKFGDHWWVFVGTIAANMALLAAVIWTSSIVADRFRPVSCPECGGEIETTSRGFYDSSFVPLASEVVSAVVFLGIVISITVFFL